MAFYTLSVSNTALSTTNDTLTIITATNRRIKLHEVSIGGMGTVSAANELAVAKSTGGTTGSAALATVATSVDMAAPAFTNFTAWSAQPTFGTNVIMRLPVNANGGVYRWVAKPGTEPEIRGAGTLEQWSYRSVVGTSTISFHTTVEEI